MTPAPRHTSLRRIFGKVAKILGITLIAPVALYGAFLLTFYTGRGEKLTPGEKTLIENIFGPEVNTGKIRKHFKEPSDLTHILHGKQGTVMPFTSHIDFFGEAAQSKDYSTADAGRFGLFVHETTHTVQNQHGMNWKKVGQYGYTLLPDKKFNDYGVEEQADIIEDYAKKFLHRDHVESSYCKGDTGVFYPLLQKVVEDRFPAAKQARIKAQATLMSAQVTVKIPSINS